MPAPAAGCRRCGGCCREAFRRYVGQEDLARWEQSRRRDLLQVVEEEVRRKALPALDCRFLGGGPGGKAFCSIYPARPQACAEFQPGQAKICPLHPARRAVHSDGKGDPPCHA